MEADGWGNGNGTVAGLAARTSRFLVTRGGEGADEWTGPAVQRHPVFDVPVVDTNGACVLEGCSQSAAGTLATAPGAWSIISLNPLSSYPCRRRRRVRDVVHAGGGSGAL